MQERLHMNKLENIQSAFQDIILGKNSNFTNYVVKTKNPSTKTRINIYADGYELRLLEILKSNYEKVLLFLGENKFKKLAREYITKYPSDFKSIRYFGDKFANFVLNETNVRNKLFLASLIRFEWFIEKAFDVPNQTPLTTHDLQQIPPEDWSEMRFSFHPSLSIEEFDYDVQSVWGKLVSSPDSTNAITTKKHKQAILFWRTEITNYYRSLDHMELLIIKSAIAKRNFTDLCEDLINNTSLSEIDTINKVSGFLKQWVLDGLIVGVYKHLILKGVHYE